MSDSKKYYYLKLKEDFFETTDMRLLEALPNGYIYSNILLKLYLKSLRDDGRLMYKGNIPYDVPMIAAITGHNPDVIKGALQTLNDMQLIDVLDNGAIFMLDIQNFIGQSSTEADRVRDFRRRISDERKLISGPNAPEEEPEAEFNEPVELHEEPEEVPAEQTENGTEPVQNPYKCTTNEHQSIEIRVKRLDLKEYQKILSEQTEILWKLYPRKEGKEQAFKKIPKLIKTYGFEAMKTCVMRYAQKVKDENTLVKFIKQGSTFFNGGYVDYMDENFKEIGGVSSGAAGEQPESSYGFDYGEDN